MAVKTFTTGEVLTSANTNTYLANSGLVFVKQETFAGVGNAPINDVFVNATYRNYRVLFYATRNTTSGITLRLRTGTTDDTNANYGNQYATFNNATLSAAGQNLTAFNFNGTTDSQSLSVTFDIFNPNDTVNTLLSGQSEQGLFATASANSLFWGRKADTTAYTGLNFIASTGTISGNIVVYGYRNA